MDLQAQKHGQNTTEKPLKPWEIVGGSQDYHIGGEERCME
jgi:hypothetical protein